MRQANRREEEREREREGVGEQQYFERDATPRALRAVAMVDVARGPPPSTPRPGPVPGATAREEQATVRVVEEPVETPRSSPEDQKLAAG